VPQRALMAITDFKPSVLDRSAVVLAALVRHRAQSATTGFKLSAPDLSVAESEARVHQAAR
jgi:hypothetical protein